jgi:hypothetical protein
LSDDLIFIELDENEKSETGKKEEYENRNG